MYAVEVSDQIMIAHSFRGAVFGPAQELHGATFVVRAAFFSDRLDENGIVVDIGRAHDVLKAALKPLNYRNLDDLPQFKGVNTTTEFLTRYVYDLLADAARSGKLGRRAANCRRSASRWRNRRARGPGTRPRCDEAGGVRGSGRPVDADRRLCL